MGVTLIIQNVVYILDDINMLPNLTQKGVPALSNSESEMQAPLRILYVEDNDYVRDLTLCLLESERQEVIACKSAEEALEVFRRGAFDVVITDVSLPNMSGIELAKRLLDLAPRTWVVLASGYQFPVGTEQLGTRVRVVTKPFEADAIEPILKEVRDAIASN